MAIAVQQIHPVAQLPLVLGVLRRLEVASLLDHLIPPTRRMCFQQGMEAKLWVWPFWMAIMRSTRWGNG